MFIIYFEQLLNNKFGEKRASRVHENRNILLKKEFELIYYLSIHFPLSDVRYEAPDGGLLYCVWRPPSALHFYLPSGIRFPFCIDPMRESVRYEDKGRG